MKEFDKKQTRLEMMAVSKFAYECWRDVLVVDTGALGYHVRCSVVQMRVQVQVQFKFVRRQVGVWVRQLDVVLILTAARKICKADTISSSLGLLVKKKSCREALRAKGICCFCFCFSAGTKESGKSLRLVGVGEIRGPGLQGGHMELGD